MCKYKIGLALFLIAQVLDCILTYIGLGRGFLEGNPIAVYLFAQFGIIPGMLILKTYGVGIGYTFYYFNKHTALAVGTFLTYLIAVVPWTYALLVMGKP